MSWDLTTALSTFLVNLQAGVVSLANSVGIGTTSTDGITVANDAPSTAGVPVQMSPRLVLKGRAWNSTGSVDETNAFFIENLPATAAGTNPPGTFKLGYRNNAGTVTYPLKVASAGDLTIPVSSSFHVESGFTLFSNTSGLMRATQYGANSGVMFDLSKGTGLLGIANVAATAGVGLDVTTDATLKVRTRAQTADAQLSAASVRGNAVAFASVPTPVEGMLVAVTDSSTATWGATITGGGANHVLAFYNGSAWTVAGK